MATKSGEITWDEWLIVPFTTIEDLIAAKGEDEAAVTLQECAMALKDKGIFAQMFLDADPRLELGVKIDDQELMLTIREGNRVVLCGAVPEVFATPEDYEQSRYAQQQED